MVYYVEFSTNLIDWTTLKQIITDETNAFFHSFDSDPHFYRIRQADDRIRFPDWSEYVEMYLYYGIWTSLEGGTYHFEVYGDGNLLYQNTRPVRTGVPTIYTQSDKDRLRTTGYMDIAYEEAYEFAKRPLGRGVDPTLQSNPEANGFVKVGCTDCFFDL